MKILMAALVVGGGVVVLANDAGDERSFKVASHHFLIPQAHIFEMAIPWLPKSESDAFTFLLEPNPDPNRIPKYRILVERLSRFCPTSLTTDASQMLRIACGQEAAIVDEEPPFVRIGNERSSWSSDLYAIDKSRDEDGVVAKRPVAFCQLFEPNPAKPYPSNLCTTFWAYKGLMLQFSFDETESSDMPAMKARAMTLLEQWEVR